MNRLIRMLTISGVGLVAGAAIGAGPAMATSSTAPSAAQPSTTSTAAGQAHRDWDRDRAYDYFDSRWDCERAGRWGERRDRWEDYDCEYVRHGRHRGDYALFVEYDRWNH